MLPDRVSNPGPLTYESGALAMALRGPAQTRYKSNMTGNKIGNTGLESLVSTFARLSFLSKRL